MNRRKFTTTAIAGLLAATHKTRAQQPKPEQPQPTPTDVRQAPGVRISSFILDEITVSDLQQKIKRGELTAERIAELYLERIEEIDRRGPMLRSVLEVNPD